MMSNDELIDWVVKEWIETHTIGDISPHDGAVMVFKEGLEKGVRTERERIVDKLEAIDDPDYLSLAVQYLIDELRENTDD